MVRPFGRILSTKREGGGSASGSDLRRGLAAPSSVVSSLDRQEKSRRPGSSARPRFPPSLRASGRFLLPPLHSARQEGPTGENR